MTETNRESRESREKPLLPLPNGNVLIVGVKSSNLDDELKNHPRIVVWDSQNEHWTNKDMPFNIRAVFMTRFVSHKTSTKILAESRKRGVNVFNPSGTGIIVRQVKELLNMNPTIEETMTTQVEVEEKASQFGKLKPLYEFINFSKSNVENAHFLMEKAKELGINTTLQSMSQLMVSQRRKQTATAVPRSIQPKLDVSVEMLDNIIREIGDMRDFLIATVEENRMLRARVDRLKKVIEE